MADTSFLGRFGRQAWKNVETAPASREAGRSERVSRAERPLHLAVVALLLLLISYLGFLVFRGGEKASAAALAVGLACLAIGALLGFIFAIPKRTEVALTRSTVDADEGSAGAGDGAPTVKATIPESAYRPNTSLEEISDWLTKIIVGVGLVQAQAIGRFIADQGAAVAPELYGSGASSVLGSATLVAITVLTFLSSFLYFRLYLAEEFTRSDQDALRVQDGYERAKEKGRTQTVGPVQTLAAIQRSSTVPVGSPSAPEAAEADTDAGATTEGEQMPASLNDVIRRKLEQMRDNPIDPADPAKGVFGGTAVVEGSRPRALTATVRPLRRDPHNFKIDLVLTSGDPKLRGQAVFFYHPTFETSHEFVRVSGGQARVRLYAYGAFTVGVLCDNGETELELDLSELSGVPEAFLED